jgi:hypothetical protein
VRTTIDLPPDLHRIARKIATESGRSLSAVVSDLVRRGLRPPGDPVPTRQGFPLLDLPRKVTTEDVRTVDDE